MQPAQGAGRAFTVLLALAAGVALTFLALPLVALFTQVPLDRVPSLLGDPAVRDAVAVTLRTNAIANALIVLVGTPVGYLLASRRFRGRALAVTLVELPLVLPPAVAGIALLAAFGRTGLLGGELDALGVQIPFTQAAVVLAVAFVESPFFARGLGEFGATIIFAGSLQGVTQTLPLAVYAQFEQDFDTALAISALFILVGALLLIALKLYPWFRFASTSR